jgi:hypothetical protein
LPGCPLSSASLSRPFNATTVVSSITTPLAPFSPEVFSCVCLVRTSPHNGKAKRMIRTTHDVMRTLLIQASLPPRFWAESLHTATYLLNHLPSIASPTLTPHHALFGTPPTYDHLHVFGCACYSNLAATAPYKLAPRSTRWACLVSWTAWACIAPTSQAHLGQAEYMQCVVFG